MRTVNVQEFSPYIVPQAEGCPDFVMRQAVAATVSDICKRTGCLTTALDFKAKAGEGAYELRLAEGLLCEVVRAVYVDGCAVNAVTNDMLARMAHGFDVMKAVGYPRFYTFVKPDRLTLVPAPSVDKPVRVIATCSVKRDTQFVPEVFFTDYLDAVIYGSLNRIFRYAGQTYTNIRLADEYELKFNAEIAEIRIDVARDFTRTTGRVFFNRII